MSAIDPWNEWEQACERAKSAPHDARHAELIGRDTIEAARQLLALARSLAGVACPRCGGDGECIYGSTTTWRGGIGGAAMTRDVCDQCWGTGRNDRTGVDQRKDEETRESLCWGCYRSRNRADGRDEYASRVDSYVAACNGCGQELG